MTDQRHSAPSVQQFIESMGVYFEHFDLPRTCGRIVGLLLVSDRPLTLDDMAAALQLSRASASTNIRLAVGCGLAEQISMPGDRHDYYRCSDDPWTRRLVISAEATAALRRVADAGLAAVATTDEVARARLDEMREFCDFLQEILRDAMTLWHERTEAPGVTEIVDTRSASQTTGTHSTTETAGTHSTSETAGTHSTSETAGTTAHPSRPAPQVRFAR